MFATRILAAASVEAGVSSLTLISTDKALQPTNGMGASKREVELVIQALVQYQSAAGTRLAMVRFGNVPASSGSILPLSRKEIARDSPISLTYPEINRY